MKKLTGYMAGINLGGWISQYKPNLAKNPEHHFETFVTEKDIEQIASWGMDHVRLPFDYSLMEWDEEKGAYNDLAFGYMDKCLEWCKKYGLNLIFDMHQAPGYIFDDLEANNLFDDPEKQDRYVDVWCTIVKRFRGEGGNIMFELLNEIVEKTPARWNALALRVLKAIREIDDEHWIVIGGLDYNSPWRLKDLPDFQDDKIVYNFHMYSPMQLTHYKAYWVEDMKNYDGPAFFYPSPMKPYRDYADATATSQPRFDSEILHSSYVMDARYIEKFLVAVDEFLAEHDVPLYCGEYGVIELTDIESRANWTYDMAQYCLKRGIGRAAWSYRDMDFTFVNKDNTPIDPELIKAAALH
ncbi:MAG: cellulase family glycosylhydrolase [Lachnospiraceae bacterium]|nr:cellulase family glycosylhydrolase [Lachnospiraceae bacterium]